LYTPHDSAEGPGIVPGASMAAGADAERLQRELLVSLLTKETKKEDKNYHVAILFSGVSFFGFWLPVPGSCI